MHVDHNHETGEIRGILCNGCNTAIGLIHEDLVVAKRIIYYLSDYQIKRVLGVPFEFPSVTLAKLPLAMEAGR